MENVLCDGVWWEVGEFRDVRGEGCEGCGVRFVVRGEGFEAPYFNHYI